ncbi:MAG: Circadian clock protein KaiB [Mucilaginibacter sp.]|jgi:circadian clock protein KaiB|nr:Circadian clock protein KaiB [Mucilaginibacter sp.]MDB5016269.1 Circadian clock protein KaiB [Mucilaginibacter sp.]MDB5138576.1 Circadian clock protein KaiB [Mucilaginibacter sp.]
MTDQPHVPVTDTNFDNDDIYRLRLFVTGATPNSTRAILNLKEVCETYLKGKYELEIVDVYQQPRIAESEQIIALPMLIKKSPLPQRRLIGDMSDTDKVLRGLNIQATE